MIKYLVPKLSACLTIFLITSCATTPELAPYSNLIGQGLLPVSTTNPYLGANLFLGAEAQRSSYLLNFLKGRGGPVAIALEQATLSDTPNLLMYYPTAREVFRAELQRFERSGVVMGEWVVRGPYAIERRDYRELGRLDGSLVGEPVFMIRGKQTKFGQQASSIQASSSSSALPSATIHDAHSMPVLVPVVPTPKAVHKLAKTSKGHAESKAPVSQPVEQPTLPLNSDQQALRLAQGLVEKNSAGDAIHIVISEKQTLAKLAEWYTGSADNSAAIAEASGIVAGKEPSLASRVVIPAKLLKTDKRLTE